MAMRVVLDANQFVSAMLVPVGHPAQILDAWRQGDLDVLTSQAILAEVRRVLLYPLQGTGQIFVVGGII